MQINLKKSLPFSHKAHHPINTLTSIIHLSSLRVRKSSLDMYQMKSCGFKRATRITVVQSLLFQPIPKAIR